MARKYNISSKSDMRRFSSDLEKAAMSTITNSVNNRSFQITCPHCNAIVSTKSGKNPCVSCGEVIDLQLDFK